MRLRAILTLVMLVGAALLLNMSLEPESAQAAQPPAAIENEGGEQVDTQPVEAKTAAQAANEPNGDSRATQALDGRDGRELSLKIIVQEPAGSVANRHDACVVSSDRLSFTFFLQAASQSASIRRLLGCDGRNQIAISVSLDGQLGSQLDEHIRFFGPIMPIGSPSLPTSIGVATARRITPLRGIVCDLALASEPRINWLTR